MKINENQCRFIEACNIIVFSSTEYGNVINYNTCAANSDGSITKTATAVTQTSYVFHSVTKRTHTTKSYSYTSSVSYGTCSVCGTTGIQPTLVKCGEYGCARGVEYIYTCPKCGSNATYTIPSHESNDCSQGCPATGSCQVYYRNTSGTYTTSYTYGDTYLGYGHLKSSGSVTHYENKNYGYSGSSSTFKVYPITIVNKNNINYTVSVSGCTAVDAAMSGKSVTVKPSGVTAGTLLKLTNNGVINTMDASSAYTFTMPSKPVIIALDLAKLPQSLTITTPVSKTYNASRFNLNVSVSQ